MAEYVLVVPKIHKFITETTLYDNGDMQSAGQLNVSRMKVIHTDSTGSQEVCYLPLTPRDTTSCADATGVFANTASANSNGTNQHYRNSAEFDALKNLKGGILQTNENKFRTVDGVTYHGVSSAYFTAILDYIPLEISKSGTFPLAFTTGFLFPTGGVLKVVMYNSASGTISVMEIQCENEVTVPQTVNGYSPYAGGYVSAARGIGVRVNKAADDIVLAIEFEYPKHDITLIGAGLQYSLDDGVTFADVTDGLVLEQVEHIVFKNTGTDTHNIGTAVGAADFAAIAAGATYVVVPTADGTLYIS